MPDDALTDADRRHLRRAIELAVQAREAGDQPFGAVLADREDHILAEDRNSQHTDQNPTAHAELNLLRRFGGRLDAEDLPAATLYASGEPCSMCAAAIAQAGIRRVVFGASMAAFHRATGARGGATIGVSGPDLLRTVEPLVEVIGPQLEAEAVAAFRP